jgi:beta-glucanase (GH16 family)
MKKFFLLAVLFCSLSFHAQVMMKIYTDSIKTFVYKGGDEFNADQLDESAWKKGLGGRRVLMAQDLAFEPGNIKTGNGMVTFVADRRDSLYNLSVYEVDSSYLKKQRRELPEQKWTTRYTAGAIVSRNKFHYGMYELRFKVEEGKGVWPAFWFYGGNRNEEIDVFELKGERNNEVHVDVHCPEGCAHGYRKTRFSLPGSYGGWMPVSKYLHEGFNHMLFEWDKGQLTWYINGHPLAYYRGEFANPMNIFLNTSVAKTGEAFSPGPDSTTKWPNHFYVDYLRIWEPLDDTAVPVLKVNRSLDASNRFISDYTPKPQKHKGLMYRKKLLNPILGVIIVSAVTPGKLNIQVLGKMADIDPGLIINGAHTNIRVKVENKETLVEVDPRDNRFTLLFNNGCRPFSRKLLVNW